MDHDLTEMTVAIIAAVFASSGFWMFLQAFTQKRSNKKSATVNMLLGLGHDRIVYLCKKYKAAGCVSVEDLESLYNYLYVPYLALGGNGTAKKYMEDVLALPTEAPHVHAPHKVGARRKTISKEEIK
jgi:hypothetical protein